MENLRIVLVPVDGTNGRKIAEHFENFEVTLQDIDGLPRFSLTEFMDYCNDQEFNPEKWWVTYVKLKSN